MVMFLLALIGTVVVMAILSIGRLGFGRREVFNWRKFFRWFAWYFVINYVLCLFILYVSLPALTGPFGGWQWLLWPLVISSIANLFAFIRPALSLMEAASATSQGRSSSRSSTPTQLPTNASRGAIAAGIFGLVVAVVIGIAVSGLIVVFTTWFDSNAKALAAIPNVTMEKTQPCHQPTQIILCWSARMSPPIKVSRCLALTGKTLAQPKALTPQAIRCNLLTITCTMLGH